MYGIKNAKMVMVIPNPDVLKPILLTEPAFQFLLEKNTAKNFSFAEHSVMAFLLSHMIPKVNIIGEKTSEVSNMLEWECKRSW